MHHINYIPSGPTIEAFHECNEDVYGVKGPFSSGKTQGCLMEILLKSLKQKPNPSGIRPVKWIILKNTYQQIEAAILPDWFLVFPRETDGGSFKKSPLMDYKLEWPLTDGSTLFMEAVFISAYNPRDIGKFKGIQATGLWANELSEIPESVFNAALARTDRYPLMKTAGVMPTWSGAIFDTNPPTTKSWVYRVFEKERPKGYKIFHQPSGFSLQAENIQNLRPGFYERLARGKSQEWIDVFINGNYGNIFDGKRVIPDYNPRMHDSDEPMAAMRNKLFIGVDFGLTPAAIFLMRQANGCIVVLEEITLQDAGIERLANEIKYMLSEKFPEHQSKDDIEIFGDPAGNSRNSNVKDEKSAIQILAAMTGLKVSAAPSNGKATRIEAARRPFNRMIDGRPGIVINKSCQVFREGLLGGYHYKAIRDISGAIINERHLEEPFKNEYSHIQDAFQYAMLGIGEARDLTKPISTLGLLNTDKEWELLNQRLHKENDSWGI